MLCGTVVEVSVALTFQAQYSLPIRQIEDKKARRSASYPTRDAGHARQSTLRLESPLSCLSGTRVRLTRQRAAAIDAFL